MAEVMLDEGGSAGERRLVRSGLLGLELLFALVPVLMIGYLQLFQDPALVFHHHAFHELAILVATLSGAALTWASWRCYLASGEAFLRWLTLGFLGFTTIYVMHGVFTRLGEHNLWLFILYGPVSRVVMAACLLMGMLQVGRPQHSVPMRVAIGPWRRALLVFVLIDVLVAVLAWSPVAGAPWLRQGFEWGAILLCVASLATRAVRRSRSPLFNLFAYALVSFALSSWAFTLARPWNHQWWLAHLVFAGGFLLLGYGVLQAFLTTRSFAGVFSQEELFHRLERSLADTREANEALRAQARAAEAARDEFESLFALAPDGILLLADDGRILKANGSLARMFGHAETSLPGMLLTDLLPAWAQAGAHAGSATVQAQPAVGLSDAGGVQRGVRRDGTTFPCEINLAPMSFAASPCSIAVVRDMTRSERMQEALRERERTLAAVLKALPVGVWIADREGHIQSDNPAARALWGEIADLACPPSGQLVVADAGSPPPPTQPALNLAVQGALQGRQAVPEQLLTVDLGDGGRHTVISSATPIVGEGGEVLGAVSVFQDMSRWLALEQELFDKTRRLEASNRELEQFAYVASHDLQEPLRKISSFVQLFARRYEHLVDDTGRSYIGFVVDGAARMRNLIEDLLSYSRVSRVERQHQAVDLAALLQGVQADLELEIRAGGVRVEVGTLPRVLGDPVQLRALFQNLLSNAVKYRSADAPKVEVGGVVEDGNAHLWVRDNGIGIDPAYFERIFVIFQRLHTREEYPGTGIGLAICRKIVESHGGRLWVESAEHQGACFHFTLPLVTETG